MTDVINTSLPEPGDTADLTEVVAAVREATMSKEDAQPTPVEHPVPEQPKVTPPPSQTPVNAPGLKTVPVEGRAGADTSTGSSKGLSWGARSDVGLIREHNEDSFLVQAPLFAVCDGMGGHAAGEVASSLAVQSLSRTGVDHVDDALLGTAVETANADIINAVENGVGKPGMGCTATCVVLEGDRMAVAHVGDSRVYVLHMGTLVRVTHDHSFVEELIDAGEITADEARIHPSRSVITRALGSDPEMYADHFTLEVEQGDRIIICSDGLSSMVPDSIIESVAVSSASPQQAADNLVSCALSEGGHDNVTVVVVDVVDDGSSDRHHREFVRHLVALGTGLLAVVAVFAALGAFYVRQSWYLSDDNGSVGIHRGVNAQFLGIDLSELSERTDVSVSDLPDTTQKQLAEGIPVSSHDEAVTIVEGYLAQIEAEKARAAEAADSTQSQSEVDENGDPVIISAEADGVASATNGSPAQPSDDQAKVGD